MTQKLTHISYLIIFITCLHACSIKDNLKTDTRNQATFSLLDGKKTGINFQNKLKDGPNTNILMYEYFFNGGGVAVGDFNSDGFEDLYFTSNMGGNKLYLNRGDMLFKDITALSGTSGRAGPWKTGVSAVDINGDGLLDIYLCYSGALPPDKRKNQLFINQGNSSSGNPTFQEMAAEYNLDLSAYSNQAYFFDYDMDGDLDMLLLNHNPKNLPILNLAGTQKLLNEDEPEMGLRLLVNNEGKFVDKTLTSGLNGSALSYGLGLSIGDFNNDGYSDFYVSNDYTVPDYLYINQKDGSFKNELSKQMGHTSMFSMGNDAADINNDGYLDIFTLDMLPEDNKRQKLLLAPDNYGKFDLNVKNGFYYQYMRNMLQLNNGNETFSEVGQVLGVSNTDWSWSALFADYNNDGWKDLYVTNGYNKDYTNLDFIKYMNNYVGEKGRLTRDMVLEIVDKMPASEVVNYIYENKNGINFENQVNNWGVNYPSNSNGAAYTDLDNDGDLDLVVNNINQAAFIFRNNTIGANYLQVQLQGERANTHGLGAKVSIYTRGEVQVLLQNPNRGYLSSVTPVLHFGLGKHSFIDSLKVEWPRGGVELLGPLEANQRITLKESEAGSSLGFFETSKPIFIKQKAPISYKHEAFPYRDFDRQLLLVDELSFEGPVLYKIDFNQDGLEDVFIGGSKGQEASIYLQGESNSFKKLEVAVFQKHQQSVDTGLAYHDFDGDGHKDLIVSSGGYHKFQMSDSTFGIRMYSQQANGSTQVRKVGSNKDPIASLVSGDFNDDGHQDLFLGGGVIPGRFPSAVASKVWLNDGKGGFSESESHQLGMITDLKWADLDKDGKNEIIVIAKWRSPVVLSYESGAFIQVTHNFIETNHLKGLWNTLELADLNGDGKLDWVLGNRGLNSQLKASVKEPASLFYGDLDGNGTIDPILSFYIQGESYPYITKGELGKQIPSYQSQYPSYESFSTIDTKSLFKEKQGDQYVLNELKTILLMSTPTGAYKKVELPLQAQYAPIKQVQVLDVNKDGKDDLLLFGNNQHTKLRFGKADANYGCMLINKGNANFTYVDQKTSGLNSKGDVRSSLYINKQLLLGKNGGTLEAYDFY